MTSLKTSFNLPENNEDDDSDNNSHSDGGEDAESKENEKSEADNKGTLILDATCAPQNISYPQDINLLNEARENLESIIDDICYTYNFYKPRMYRKNARKDYLNLAKCKKRTKKKIRKAIKQQLQYIRRDLGYIDMFVLANGVVLTEKQAKRLTVIKELYEQQKYMYDNNVHSVKDRIVSISQPYIRPIVRGKAKAPVEFGAKLDMSIDERSGCAHLGNREIPQANRTLSRKGAGRSDIPQSEQQSFLQEQGYPYIRSGFGASKKRTDAGGTQNCIQ